MPAQPVRGQLGENNREGEQVEPEPDVNLRQRRGLHGDDQDENTDKKPGTLADYCLPAGKIWRQTVI